MAILAFAFAIGGCGRPGGKDFERLALAIPTLSTPLSFSHSGSHLQVIDSGSFDTSLARIFLPKDIQVLGRLYPERGFVTLLLSYPGDVPYVSMYTYKSDGSPIDTVYITGEYFVERSAEVNSTTTIDSRGLVVVRDTVTTAILDDDDRAVPGTTSTKIHVRTIQLGRVGFFAETDSVFDGQFHGAP